MNRNRVLLLLWMIGMGGSTLGASDLSVYGGWSEGGELQAGELDLRNFSVLGLRYEKDFLVAFGFENTLAYASNPLVPRRSPGDGGMYYTSAVVLNLPVVSQRTVPNLSLGLGFLHPFGDQLSGVGTTFLTQWGAGFKLKGLAGPFGLRFDYRRFTLHDVRDSDVRTQEVTGGLLVSF